MTETGYFVVGSNAWNSSSQIHHNSVNKWKFLNDIWHISSIYITMKFQNSLKNVILTKKSIVCLNYLRAPIYIEYIQTIAGIVWNKLKLLIKVTGKHINI